MRKKTVNHLADTIFWYLLYFFPILAYMIYLFAESCTSIMSFGLFFSSMGFDFVTNNFLLVGLSDIFGVNGIMPLFQNDLVFYIFVWYIGIYLIHLAVDFLLFIPRLAHKYMNKCIQND